VSIGTIRDYLQHEILGETATDIAVDQNLLLSGILDSLGVFRLIAHLEDEFDIEIPPQDVTLENFATLAKIDAYVRSHRG
jgi:acyl carrier protein